MTLAESTRLYEHRPTFGLRLDPDERDALRSAKVAIDPVPGAADVYDVRPGSWVGVVRVGKRQFEIVPKIGVTRLLYLLSRSMDLRWWRDELVDLEDETSLVAAMAVIYGRALDAALNRGVVRGYRRRADAGLTVRGRIDIATQVRRRHGRLVPLHVDYDDYTVDVDENRILLSALARLRHLRARLPEATRRQLARALTRLEDVTPFDLRARHFPQPTITRLNSHYRHALALGQLILRGASLEAHGGQRTADALLFNMNQVFEDFVVRSLREELDLSERNFPQNAARRGLTLDEPGAVRLRPDLSWWEDGRPVFVGDVKYKRITADGINHPDLYQLLAYTTATDVPAGLLIYAAGEESPARHVVRHHHTLLEVTEIDLERDIAGLDEEITRIAASVRRQAAATRGVPAHRTRTA